MNIIAIMGPHGVFYKDEPIKELESALVAQGFQIIWPQNSVDLLKFIEYGDWLWTACWKLEELNAAAETQSAQSQSMMMVPVSATVPIEQNAEEKMGVIDEILILLDDIWTNDKEVRKTVDKQQWDEFVGTLENMLYELESGL